MFGGPFYSAGAVRVINGVTYRYRGVGYAHWVTLMNGGHSADHFEIRKGRRLVAKVKTREDVEAFFAKLSDKSAKPSDWDAGDQAALEQALEGTP